MTFEEFFRKKKINLATFSQAEERLFAEFKTHYATMGEKSFDHTKKYWFNKLRRLYPAPPEIKAGKVVIENQLAEQTITETLTEPAETPAPAKTGFTPRFKAGVVKPKPVEPTPLETEQKAEAAEQPAAPAKTGFTPRFKAGNTTAKSAEITDELNPEGNVQSAASATPAQAGFKAGVTTNKNLEPEIKADDKDAKTPSFVPKVGFKPRFKPPQQ